MRTRFPIDLVIFSAILSAGCATTGGGGGADLSGTWRTEAAVPYVIEPSANLPHGVPVPHDGIELVERFVQLEFELLERPGGIVVGTNRWVIFDENSAEVRRAEEPLLGARDRDRAVLVEPADEVAGSPQIIFEFSMLGPDRLSGIGYDVGSTRLIALRFELVRAP